MEADTGTYRQSQAEPERIAGEPLAVSVKHGITHKTPNPELRQDGNRVMKVYLDPGLALLA